jgi:hypothetical protein
MGHFHNRKLGPGPIKFCPWVIFTAANLDLGQLNCAHGTFSQLHTWTRANKIVPMGHFHNCKLGLGPINLYPWAILTAAHLDLGQ